MNVIIFPPPLSGYAPRTTSDNGLCKRMRALMPASKPTHRHCSYCCDEKPIEDFKYPLFVRSHSPKACIKALKKAVCYDCLKKAVEAQLDTRRASRIACPDCNKTWTPDIVQYLLPKHRIEEYDHKRESEKGQIRYTPPSDTVLKLLLFQKARICPYCGIAVVRNSGCECVVCGDCQSAFQFNRARSLKSVDQQWRRLQAVQRVAQLRKDSQRDFVGWV